MAHLILLLVMFAALTASFCPPPNPRRLKHSSSAHFDVVVSQKLHNLHATAIFSTTISPSEEKILECHGCKRIFNSRNALFKHIRGDGETVMDCSIAMKSKPMLEEELLMTAVIRYGYFDGRTDGSINSNQATNEVVAKMIHEAFIHSVNRFLNEEDDNEIGNENVGRSQFREGKIFSTTALSYSSAAIMRQPALRQDEEVVGAASEVLSFNYRFTHQATTIVRWTEYAKRDNVQEHMQMWLDKECSSIQIELHHMDSLVPRSSKFYAERSATQRSYTYLMPVNWILPATNDEADKYSARRSDSISQVIEWGNNLSQRSLQQHRKHEPRAVGQSKHSPECILALKRSLNSIESVTVPNRRVRRREERDKNNDDGALGDTEEEEPTSDTLTRLSHGRFGQLWRKEKKCWSNFSSLTGMASSPGFEAVWRTMDRAKIVGVIDVNGKSNINSMEDAIEGMHIIIEFKADGFVVGEIPRIISAVVAMTNGWLPANFFDISTRPENYLPPPTPPPLLHRLYYFQSARYHFHELASNTHGVSFARAINTGSQSEIKWEDHLKKMLVSCVASSASKRLENEWLSDLCNVVSPDLRRRVESFEAEHLEHHSQEIVHGTSSILPLELADAPVGAYSVTLALLRDIVEKGLWPATSEARSRVIKSPSGSSGNILATKKRTIASLFPGNTISSGSFTVINEQFWQGHELPLGNSMFAPLRKAVFELEEEIIRKNSPITAAAGMSLSSLRRPSTHCAVNRNAQFTPHVDSGRGLGQSVSLIVGLGNYTGGEILVEGQSYDIRYNPLEFDGWNQLHWTSSFQGER